jgi:hypothetical protein
VAFVSEASNLVRAVTSAIAQIYVHDRVTGSTELASRRPDGRPGDGPSRHPSLSGEGSLVAFQTLSSDLLCSRRCASHERDINLVWDVYTVDEHDADATTTCFCGYTAKHCRSERRSAVNPAPAAGNG